MQPEALANLVVESALAAADPAHALRRHWDEPGEGPVHVLAVGKASIPMAAEATLLLGSRFAGGVCTCPPAYDRSTLDRAWTVFECDHPYPTPRNMAAAETVARFVAGLREPATLVVLLSGGASAHVAWPAQGLALDDLAGATRALQLAGASIRELNTVRKHCERLKGGRLAAMCPTPIHAYVLSDVVGDPLDVIGSGPTAPDPTTYAQALAAVACRPGVPAPVLAHLRAGAAGRLLETPKPDDPCFRRVRHRVISSNRAVVAGVEAALRAQGLAIADTRTAVEGEASRIGSELASHALKQRPAVPSAWVVGGEWTVTVGAAPGQGGPSQELALEAAVALDGQSGVCLVAFSTDGRDGPTDAAGAVVTGRTAAAIRNAGLDPAACLARHASHQALEGAGALVRVPATGTNLNHVAVLVVLP
jgi:glycerate 2-kinase